VDHKFAAITVAALVVTTGAGIRFAAALRIVNEATQTNVAGMEIATFGGGCFWSLEAAFRQVKGVTDTGVGYAVGAGTSPTGDTVCRPRTDSVEACRVTFDPTRITYEQLVKYFFEIHNRTLTDGTGPFVGSPGRLIIFFHNVEQERIATAVMESQPLPENNQRSPLVQVLSESEFCRADEADQRYLEKQGLANCSTKR
jgi:peptide-methionine (S)-S-oxide reductase